MFALLLGAVVQGAETNSMRVIAKAAFSGIQEECQTVVTNQTQWDALWNRHQVKREPKEPAPAVDFSKETVLAVALGEKRTGGYSVEITQVECGGEKAIVRYRVKSPKPGSLTLQALSAPIHIVAVPRLSSAVEFKRQE